LGGVDRSGKYENPKTGREGVSGKRGGHAIAAVLRDDSLRVALGGAIGSPRPSTQGKGKGGMGGTRPRSLWTERTKKMALIEKKA